jgi:hypothetical protein
MFLAEKTVKNYVSALFAKLGIERRTQAEQDDWLDRRGTNVPAVRDRQPCRYLLVAPQS